MYVLVNPKIESNNTTSTALLSRVPIRDRCTVCRHLGRCAFGLRLTIWFSQARIGIGCIWDACCNTASVHTKCWFWRYWQSEKVAAKHEHYWIQGWSVCYIFLYAQQWYVNASNHLSCWPRSHQSVYNIWSAVFPPFCPYLYCLI